MSARVGGQRKTSTLQPSTVRSSTNKTREMRHGNKDRPQDQDRHCTKDERRRMSSTAKPQKPTIVCSSNEEGGKWWFFLSCAESNLLASSTQQQHQGVVLLLRVARLRDAAIGKRRQELNAIVFYLNRPLRTPALSYSSIEILQY